MRKRIARIAKPIGEKKTARKSAYDWDLASIIFEKEKRTTKVKEEDLNSIDRVKV